MIIEREINNKKILIDIKDIETNKDRYLITLNSISVDKEEIELYRNKIIKNYEFKYFLNGGEQVFCLSLEGETACSLAKKVIGSKRDNIKIVLSENKEFMQMLENAEKEVQEKFKKYVDDEDNKLINYDLNKNVSIRDYYNFTFISMGIDTKVGALYKISNSFNNLKKMNYIVYRELLKKYSNEIQSEYGEYTTVDTYTMRYKSFLELCEDVVNKIKEINKIKKEKEKEREIRKNLLIEQAKITGEKQLVSKWSEPCSCADEDCEIDIVYEYINESGIYSYERQHTW